MKENSPLSRRGEKKGFLQKVQSEENKKGGDPKIKRIGRKK